MQLDRSFSGHHYLSSKMVSLDAPPRIIYILQRIIRTSKWMHTTIAGRINILTFPPVFGFSEFWRPMRCATNPCGAMGQ
jgi:hypothetical protein